MGAIPSPRLITSVLKELYRNSLFYAVTTELPEERLALPAQRAIVNPARTIENYSVDEGRKTEPEHLWKTPITTENTGDWKVSLDYFLDGVQRTTLLGEIPFRRGSPHRCSLHFAQYACVVLKRYNRELQPFKTELRSLIELPIDFLRSKANEQKLVKYLREFHHRAKIANLEWVDTSFSSVRARPEYSGQRVTVDSVDYPRLSDDELMGRCADPLWFRSHARHWTTRFRDRTEYRISTEMVEFLNASRPKEERKLSLVVKDGGIASVRRGLERVILGIIKSFETQLLSDYEHIRVMSLRQGQRSPVFVMQAREDRLEPEELVPDGGRTPNRVSWYMRLHGRGSHSPEFGLVRIEIHPGTLPCDGRQDRWSEQDTLLVNAISSAISAERLPLSAPDPRWDRLIYPIKVCERYLQSLLLPQETVRHFGQHLTSEFAE